MPNRITPCQIGIILWARDRQEIIAKRGFFAYFANDAVKILCN